MAEILSGGLTWGSTQQAIVTMDKEGQPLTCKNPVTGAEISGGGSSDFSTAKVTVNNTVRVSGAENSILQNTVYDDEGFLIIQSVELTRAGEYTTILINGKSYVYMGSADAITNASGSIEIKTENDFTIATITGDCAFNIVVNQMVLRGEN